MLLPPFGRDDALGSVIATAKADQSLAVGYAFSPYGQTQKVGVESQVAGSENSSQYTGRENDNNGLYFYRARYYDPILKRFISEDPIGLAGGINSHAYVEGDPVKLTDPTGLKGWYCQRSMNNLGGDGKPGTKGPPLVNHQYLCVTNSSGKIVCGGLTKASESLTGILYGDSRITRPDEDYYDPGSCKEVDDDKNDCYEKCVLKNLNTKNHPKYGIGPQADDCQEFADDLFYGCKIQCSLKGK